jgi:hypothetical protein
MKIRTGFVSNSSSSSYILIIKKDEYDKFYNSLSKLEKHILDNLKLGDSKLGDIDIKVHKEWDNEGASWIEYDLDKINTSEYNKENVPDEYKEYFDNENYDYDITYELTEHVLDKLKKLKGVADFSVDI